MQKTIVILGIIVGLLAVVLPFPIIPPFLRIIGGLLALGLSLALLLRGSISIKKGAAILGIIGGMVALGLSPMGWLLDLAGKETETKPLFLLIFFAFIGILGGALSLIKPMVSAILMLVAAVAGLSVTFGVHMGWEGMPAIFGWVLGALFLVSGAILAIRASLQARAK